MSILHVAIVFGQGAKAPAMALPMVTGIKFFTKMSPQLNGAPVFVATRAPPLETTRDSLFDSQRQCGLWRQSLKTALLEG